MSNNLGRQRLQLLLSSLSGGLCLLLMAAVLVLVGRPYNSLWWWVMAAILALALVLPRFLARPIEWVIAGYQEALGPIGGQRQHAA